MSDRLVRQKGQFNQRWFKIPCEQLTHEKFLWLARAGTYASAANPDALLAERIEALTTIEQKDQQAASTS
jgi:hypothetical protein